MKKLEIINPSTAYKRGTYHLYFIDRKFLLKKKVFNRDYDFLLRRKNFKKMALAEMIYLGKDYLKHFSLISYLYFENSLVSEKPSFCNFYFCSFNDYVFAKLYFFLRPLEYLKFVSFVNKDYTLSYVYSYTSFNSKIIIPQPVLPETKKFIYALNHPKISMGPVDVYTYSFYRKRLCGKRDSRSQM